MPVSAVFSVESTLTQVRERMEASESWDQRNVVNTKSFKQFYRDYYAAAKVYTNMQKAGQTPVRRFTPLSMSEEELKMEVKSMIDSVWDDWGRLFNIPSLVRSRAVERVVEPAVKWKYAPSVLTGWKIGAVHSRELAEKEEMVMKGRLEELAEKDVGAR